MHPLSIFCMHWYLFYFLNMSKCVGPLYMIREKLSFFWNKYILGCPMWTGPPCANGITCVHWAAASSLSSGTGLMLTTIGQWNRPALIQGTDVWKKEKKNRNKHLEDFLLVLFTISKIWLKQNQVISCTAHGCNPGLGFLLTLYMLTFLPCSTFLTGTPAAFKAASKPKLQPR